MKTGIETMEGAWKRLSRPVKLSFFAALGTGLVVYLFILTNRMFCAGDALNNVVYDGNLTWMGRWSCKLLSSLGTDLAMPLVNGMLMILFLSMAAAVMVSLLEIRSDLLAVLAAGVVMCHPSAGATMKYLPYADGFILAALLAVAALWLTDRYVWGFLPGAALLCLSMGTYQAYLALIVSLMLVRGVSQLAGGQLDDRALLLRMLRYGLLLALGVGAYFGVTRLLEAFGVKLSDYQSVSSMGQFTLEELWRNFVGCYGDFRRNIMMLSSRPGYYVTGYTNYFLFAAGLGCMWLLTLSGGFGKGRSPWLRLALLAALTVLSPVFYCCIRLANPGALHSLMVYSTVGMHLMVIAGLQLICDRLGSRPAPDKAGESGESTEKQGILRGLSDLALRLFSWVAPLCVAVCVFVWSVGSNVDYYRGHEDYENLYAQCIAYLTLAEQTPGYERNMPIYVVGQPDGDSVMSRSRPGLYETQSYYMFMVNILKVQMPYGIVNQLGEDARVIAGTDAFAAMPAYPLPGCAQVVDGAMVVKLGPLSE